MTKINVFIKQNSVVLSLIAIGLLFSIVSGRAGKPASSCSPWSISCNTSLPDAP